MYDIIIIGGGPAGLTAAVYAARADKSVLVLEKETAGGQITQSPSVENIPGFTRIAGTEFADRLVEQAMAQGAEIEFGEVISLTDHGSYKTVETDLGDSFEAKAVIIATGAKHRHLGLEREEEFIGSGISFCAVCDGAFYKGQKVVMVGGGNSALVEAVMLSDLAAELVILQDLPFLTGEKKVQDILLAKDNVKVITGVHVVKLLGEDTLTGAVIEKNGGITEEISFDGMFVAIGTEPQNEAFSAFVELDERGYAITEAGMRTKTPGIFTAGDCRVKKIRQVATAAADGAEAALSAIDYLEGSL